MARMASAGLKERIDTTIPPLKRPAGTQSMLVRYIGTVRSSSICFRRNPACSSGCSKENEHPRTKMTRSSVQYLRMSVGSSMALPSLNTR